MRTCGSMMTASARLVSSVLLKCLCVAGFLYQVTTVSNTFFSYKTTSKVLLNSQETKVLPNMQLCIKYTDIMDLDALNREEGTHFQRTNHFSQVADIQANVTVRMIMTHVPSADQTITRCTFRNPDGLLMLLAAGEQCYRMFHVVRFLVQSFICYNFRFRGVVDFTSKQVSSSLDHPNILYGVSLNPAFSGADLIDVAVFYGTYPTMSRQFAVLVNRLSNFQTRTARNNAYVFAYSLNKVQLLGPPYDTNCRESDDEERNKCLEDCLAPMEQELDRITYTTFTHHPNDKKLINYYDLVDGNRSVTVKESLDRCEDSCAVIECMYNYTITYYDLSQRIQNSNEFRAIARTPKAPGLDVKFEAKLSLMEFIIYVCSCVGIWFGLSVLSVNPFEAILRKRIPTSTQDLRKRLLSVRRGGRKRPIKLHY